MLKKIGPKIDPCATSNKIVGNIHIFAFGLLNKGFLRVE